MITIEDDRYETVNLDTFKRDVKEGIYVDSIVIGESNRGTVAIIMYRDMGLKHKKIIFGGYIPNELEEYLGIALRNWLRGYSYVGIIKR